MNFKNQLSFLQLFPFCESNFTIISENLRIRLTEAAKIGIFHHNSRCLVHFINMQLIPNLPRKVCKEWVFTKVNMILVDTRNGIDTSMFVWLHFEKCLRGTLSSKQCVNLS